MTGKRYYITTLAAWQQHVPRCAEAHFIVLNSRAGLMLSSDCASSGDGRLEASVQNSEIMILITADEAAHVALENDAEFEALAHPLSRQPISERAADALAHFGVERCDDAFTVAEKLARVHPLLRHRVF